MAFKGFSDLLVASKALKNHQKCSRTLRNPINNSITQYLGSEHFFPLRTLTTIRNKVSHGLLRISMAFQRPPVASETL